MREDSCLARQEKEKQLNIMMNSQISISSKALYSYLYSISGETGACIDVKSLLNDLSINKETYYRHYSPLTEQGIITVASIRTVNRYPKNTYMLEDNKDFIFFKNSDFKNIMTDPDINIKAKGLYAVIYFMDNTNMPNISKKDFLTALNICDRTFKNLILQLLENRKTSSYIIKNRRVAEYAKITDK